MELKKESPVASIGVLLPGTAMRCAERRYQASKRLIQLLKNLREETITDEILEDE